MINLEEAIKHCQEVIDSCGNKGCSLDHKQLKEWLIELKYYRERYGKLEPATIILTKSNRQSERIRPDEITKIEVKEGVYNGNNYHSRIWFKNGNYHYYLETVEEIGKLIK